MAIFIPSSLGGPVTTRTFNWREMAIDAWGQEFYAPDHGVYEWSSGRKYDSTDQMLTGIYGVIVPSYLVLEPVDNYPDMPDAHMMVNGGAFNVG